MFKNNILTENIAEEWGGGVNATNAVPMYIEGNIITNIMVVYVRCQRWQ